eukprot:g5539.t1
MDVLMAKLNLAGSSESAAAVDGAEAVALDSDRTGTVLNIRGGGIARVSGLLSAEKGAVVKFADPPGVEGLVLDLEDTTCVVAILAEAWPTIRLGTEVELVSDQWMCPVGSGLRGRMVGAMGHPRDGNINGNDGGEELKDVEYLPSYRVRPPPAVHQSPMSERERLHTGVKTIDAFHTVAKGDRVVLAGHPGTGKSTVALDLLVNHARRGGRGVYVSVGQEKATADRVWTHLHEAGVLPRCTIVAASCYDSWALQYLAPFNGLTVAEGICRGAEAEAEAEGGAGGGGGGGGGADVAEGGAAGAEEGAAGAGAAGQDVLVVIDDIRAHAIACSEMSSALRRPLASSYSLYSSLLERGAQLTQSHGGGSVTIVATLDAEDRRWSAASGMESKPLVNVLTDAPDAVSAVCDRSVHFDSDLAALRSWPAISVLDAPGGRPAVAVQPPLLRDGARDLKALVLRGRQEAAAAQKARDFGIDPIEELGEDASKANFLVEYGPKLQALFQQASDDVCTLPELLAIIDAGLGDWLHGLPAEQIGGLEEEIRSVVRDHSPDADGPAEKWGELPAEVRVSVERKAEEFLRERGYLHHRLVRSVRRQD